MTMLSLHLHNWGPYGIRGQSQQLGMGNNIVWPGANLAIYSPLIVPDTFPAVSIFLANGSNLTGNICLGIYSEAGARLATTGTIARNTASSLQFVALTYTLNRGRYFIGAVASEGVTGTYARSTPPTVGLTRALGVRQEALGATVLPANMTPVAVTTTFIPSVGLSQRATI